MQNISINWMTRNLQGVPIPCAPLHSITGQGHTPNLYIFMIPHQFQIYMQDFRSPTWFTYFRWHGLWCGVEHIFVNKFCLFFGGALTKMAIKLSIIGADPYMIPHLKANIFRHEVKPYLGYCHNYVWFCRHFIESNVSNQQLDFLKKCPDTLRPPTQQNLEVIYINEQSYNKLVPIPDLFEVKWAVVVKI